jgi:dsDNA-specific endonuclease/ATPase MutS2
MKGGFSMDFTLKERHDLGLEYILDQVRVQTPFGKTVKKSLSFYRPEEKEALKKELELTRRVSLMVPRITATHEEFSRAFMRLRDIRSTVKRLDEGCTLTDLELFELKGFLFILHEIAACLKKLDLPEITVTRMESLQNLLDPEKNGMNTFHVYNAYSEALAGIRREKEDLEKRIRQAETEDGRKALLEERRKAVCAEEEEEYRIRETLSGRIRPSAGTLMTNMDSIGKLDFLLAKAVLASSHETAHPHLTEEGAIVMTDGRNPFVESILEKTGRSFCPVSLNLMSGSTVITGANMGGKSVTMRTLVLNTALTHLGILPFARAFRTTVLASIHLLSEDQENMDRGLSSFGGEVVRIREILSRLGSSPSLVVFDEPAKGTSPVEGAAIVGGILNHFRKGNHFLLVSTHYDLMPEEGVRRYQVKGLKGLDIGSFLENGEEEQIRIRRLSEAMDYSLEEWDGKPASGDAIRISELLGIPQELSIEIRKQLVRGKRNE